MRPFREQVDARALGRCGALMDTLDRGLVRRAHTDERPHRLERATEPVLAAPVVTDPEHGVFTEVGRDRFIARADEDRTNAEVGLEGERERTRQGFEHVFVRCAVRAYGLPIPLSVREAAA